MASGHTIDISDSSATVRVRVHGELVAETTRAKVLKETGIQPRWYIHPDDVFSTVLETSGHHSHCPFKGDASYYSVKVGEKFEGNLVWFYPEPIDGAAAIKGHLAFYGEHDDVEIEIEE